MTTRTWLSALISICVLSSCTATPIARTPASDSGNLKLKRGATVGEGIFAIDLSSKQITQLAYVPNLTDSQNLIKFSYGDGHKGAYDFAFVPDNDGNLYYFSTTFQSGEVTSSDVIIKLKKAEDSLMNGPAYCRARGELGFGEIKTTSVGVKTIRAIDFREMRTATPAEAEGMKLFTPIQSEDFQIATDLTCGNLKAGVAYNGLDCHGSQNVNDCLFNIKNKKLSSIHLKESNQDAAVQVTFPEKDSKITASPGRSSETVMGDNGPSIFVATDQSKHLMFERAYTTDEVFHNPKLGSEFRDGGFDALYYKRLKANGNPESAREYEIDFSQWLKKPAPHSSVLTSDLRVTTKPDRVEFTAFANFKAPNSSTGLDEDVYVGIVKGSFDYKKLSKNDNKIVLKHSDVTGVLTFGEFTCRVWDSYGMASNGNVYLYALYSPEFLTDHEGKQYIVFSTTKALYGTLKGDTITLRDGSTQPRQWLYENICKKGRSFFKLFNF